jgi:hypothetical protein
VDSKVENSIIVNASQVAQGVLDALQEFAGFSPISAIDGWVVLSARRFEVLLYVIENSL